MLTVSAQLYPSAANERVAFSVAAKKSCVLVTPVIPLIRKPNIPYTFELFFSVDAHARQVYLGEADVGEERPLKTKMLKASA